MRGIPYDVGVLLEKARDSALLAVETYNRPTASFRSGGYIVLMVIAWTSLFHAIFQKRGTKPFYRRPNSRRFQKVDGEIKRWELSECLKHHFKDQDSPVKKNLEFFIGLRNKIEHRSLPQLDDEVFGECQALLLNFEELLCSTFGDRNSLKVGLSYLLQFKKTQPAKGSPVSSAQKSFRPVKQFVDTFRSSLSTEVQSDLMYSFKVFLVPKIGNHASKDSIAVEFVRYDPSKPEEMEKYERVVALIKPRGIPVSNLGLMKPGEVVKQVAKGLNKSFNMFHHVLCYRHFNVRPRKGSSEPSGCDTRYCVYDAAHGDYLYRPEWVKYLLSGLSNPATYDSILITRGRQISSTPPPGTAA